jgi:predicted dehydrogenase
MTRVALIGCGRWGRNILRDLLVLGCEVAVTDPDPEARRHAQAVGACGASADLRDLPESDGIVIASPTSTHAVVLDAVLARNVAVFVEKPMVCDLADARRVAACGKDRLFVMDKWRYHPGVEALRWVREAGELGRPIGMHLKHVGWGTQQRDADVTWALLPHCLSIVLEVLGHLPAAKQAFAEHGDGKALTLCGVLSSKLWATMEVSVRSPVKQREFRLHCEDGVAWLDDKFAGHIKIARGAGTTGSDADPETRLISTELPLLRELRSFVKYLSGGPPPRSSASEGALIVERIHELRVLAGL